MNKQTLALSAVLLIGGAAGWYLFQDAPAANRSMPIAESSIPFASPTPTSKAPLQSVTVANVADFIDRKYRYLLSDLPPHGDAKAKARALLLERERIAGSIMTLQDRPEDADNEAATLKERLAAIDDALRNLLHTADYRKYEALRDSDAEQHRLAEYMGGISNVAPLSPEQERAVLEAKLRHKERYEAILKDLGLNRDGLTAAESAQVRNRLLQALHEYRSNFLLEARQALQDEEQFQLLSNYESTEFEREFERLQLAIGAK